MEIRRILVEGLVEPVSNWRDYDAPFTTKLRLFVRNMWIKASTRSLCCGNHGEPGC